MPTHTLTKQIPVGTRIRLSSEQNMFLGGRHRRAPIGTEGTVSVYLQPDDPIVDNVTTDKWGGVGVWIDYPIAHMSLSPDEFTILPGRFSSFQRQLLELLDDLDGIELSTIAAALGATKKETREALEILVRMRFVECRETNMGYPLYAITIEGSQRI